MSFYTDTILAESGLQSSWGLDSSPSSSQLDRQGSVTGTPGAGATSGGTSLLAADPSSTCFTFTDASNSYIDFGSVYSFTGTAAFSFECWFRTTDLSFSNHIAGNNVSAGGVKGWRFAVLSTGKLYFDRYDSGGTNDAIIGSTTLVVNTIYHLACTYDGSNLRIYVNGVLDATAVASTRSMAAGSSFRLGYQLNGSHGTAGRIDEPAIYNVAVSAARFLEHYNIGAGRSQRVSDTLGLTDTRSQASAAANARTISDNLGITDAFKDGFRDHVLANADLASFYPFDETSGTVATDLGPNGFNGTYGTLVSLGGAKLPTAVQPPTRKSVAMASGGVGFHGYSTDSIGLGNHFKFTGTQAFTTGGWYKPTDLTESNHLHGAYDYTNGWRFVCLGGGGANSGKLYVERKNAAGADTVIGSTVLVPGTKYFVHATFDGAVLRLYVNGVLDGSSASTRSLTASSTDSTFGYLGGASAPIVGSIDEWAVYTDAVDASELRTQYLLAIGGASTSHTRSISDNLGITETVTRGSATNTRTINDSLRLTDNRAVVAPWPNSEHLGLYDVVSYVKTAGATAYTRSITDAVGITDDPRYTPRVFTRAISDPVGITESFGVSAPSPAVAAGEYDLQLGRVQLPTLLNDLKETVGDQLETVGAAVVPGERRARPANLSIPVHSSGTDAFALGNRMRRQLRALLDNPAARLGALYLRFDPDPELSGWLLIGDGDLEYLNGGITFSDYKLTLGSAYVVARQRSHLQARRVEIADRRLATTPRDTKGLIYESTWSDLTPLPVTWLPGAPSYERRGLPFTGTPVAAVSTLIGAGAPQLLQAVADGDIFSLSGPPSESLLQSAALGDVIVLDRQGYVAAAVTALRDITPQASYGWEELYGPNQPISYPFNAPGDVVMQNAVCRVSLTPTTGVINVERITSSGFTATCTVQPMRGATSTALQIRDASIVEWTPDSAVLRLIQDNTHVSTSLETTVRCETFITLRRGWDAPRVESYLRANTPGDYVRLRIMPAQTGASTVRFSTSVVPLAITNSTDYDSFTGGVSGDKEPWLLIQPPSGPAIIAAVCTGATHAYGRVVGSARGIELAVPSALVSSYASAQLALTTDSSPESIAAVHGKRSLVDVRTIPTFVPR